MSPLTLFIVPSDIASFYKEELEHETGTYVHKRARASGRSLQEVLRDMVSEVVSAVRSTDDALQGERERAAWSSFMTGYFHFHTRSKRYRLQELGFA